MIWRKQHPVAPSSGPRESLLGLPSVPFALPGSQAQITEPADAVLGIRKIDCLVDAGFRPFARPQVDDLIRKTFF